MTCGGGWTPPLLDDVAAVDGVDHATGDVFGFAQVVDQDGEPIGNPGNGPPTVGANWPEGPTNPWTLVGGRAAPPATATWCSMRASPTTPGSRSATA